MSHRNVWIEPSDELIAGIEGFLYEAYGQFMRATMTQPAHFILNRLSYAALVVVIRNRTMGSTMYPKEYLDIPLLCIPSHPHAVTAIGTSEDTFFRGFEVNVK